MKAILVIAVAAITTFTACNGTTTSPNQASSSATNSNAEGNGAAASVNTLLNPYLELKNSLANDNGQEAAAASTKLSGALRAIDSASFTGQQSKIFQEVKDDMQEHAEHIGANGANIKHQREHFETLSKDVYDLVKAGTPGKTLYKDFCPMYNEGKGASWISETKEIKNPYLGKHMATCGSVKEEIK